MATARIVALQVAPAALITSEVWTHFNLQHRVTGATTWTDFFTSGATLEDLAVALLTSGVYTLDGVNSPAGNEALASQAGTEYRSRGKTAGGYGNWSEPFKAANEPETDGPLGDIHRLERDMADITTMLGFPDQESADQFLAGCLNDASDEVREIDALDDY